MIDYCQWRDGRTALRQSTLPLLVFSGPWPRPFISDTVRVPPEKLVALFPFGGIGGGVGDELNGRLFCQIKISSTCSAVVVIRRLARATSSGGSAHPVSRRLDCGSPVESSTSKGTTIPIVLPHCLTMDRPMYSCGVEWRSPARCTTSISALVDRRYNIGHNKNGRTSL